MKNISLLHLSIRCISILFLFNIPNCCEGQTSELKNLIKVYKSAPKFQIKLDSFLLDNEAQMPIDSLADCYHEIGYKWHYIQWRITGSEKHLNNAIRFTSKAADLKQKAEIIDSLSLQKSLSNLSQFQDQGDHILGSISTCKALINLNIRNRKTYNTYRRMAECYIQLGDYYKALGIIKEGIEITALDTLEKDVLALAYYTVADCYFNIDPKKYAKDIVENLQISSSLAQKSKLKPNKKNDLIINTKHLHGNLLYKIKEYDKAIEYYTSFINTISKTDSTRLTQTYNSLGLSQLKLGHIESAYSNFIKSISYDKSYTAPLENLGDYYIAKKEFKNGLQSYQNAITSNINLNLELEYNQLPKLEDLKLVQNKGYVLSHLIQKAKAWKNFHSYSRDQSHLINSLSTFQLADKLIDEIRFQSFEEQSKLFWQEKGSSLYANAVELCYILNKPKLAYYFMEKNKALLLLGDASIKRTTTLDNIPSSLIEQEFEIKRKIYHLENQYAQSEDASLNSIRQDIIHFKNKLEIFLDSIFTEYPEYAKARHKINILPFDKFKQGMINDDVVVVHYMSADSLGFGLFHTPSKSILHKIDNENFSKLLNEHLHDLRSPITEKEAFEKFIGRSNKLFQILFPEEIVALISNKNLIIIPDQNIQQLPFESLVISTNPVKYLISDSDINYQYSISHVVMNQEIARNPKKQFLGIAPESFDNQKLPELPFSKKEIEGINVYCKGELYSGIKANKANFLSSLNQYAILHLSTHASYINKESPWIAFRDEKIFLDEIYSTKNQAELVTLSACNTSIGEYKKGEGAMSLARGFFYSGSNAVVASLWPTNDKSSKELMIEFYKQLSLGNSKSKSLQEAKVQYLKNNSGSALSPYYWASTIIIGNNENINFSSSWLSKWGTLSYILIALFLFLIWYYRNLIFQIK